jgi:hypothetical protein
MIVNGMEVRLVRCPGCRRRSTIPAKIEPDIEAIFICAMCRCFYKESDGVLRLLTPAEVLDVRVKESEACERADSMSNRKNGGFDEVTKPE